MHETIRFAKAIRQAAEQLRAVRDDAQAADLLEGLRWPNGCECIRCSSRDVYAMKNRAGDARASQLRWRCRSCSKTFTVKADTPLDGTRFPMASVARGLGVTAQGVDDFLVTRLNKEAQVAVHSAAEHREDFIEMVFPAAEKRIRRKLAAAAATAAVAGFALAVAVGTGAFPSGSAEGSLVLASDSEESDPPLASDGLPNRLRDGWRHEGDSVLVTTDREEGESDDELLARHMEVVELMKLARPPDQ